MLLQNPGHPQPLQHWPKPWGPRRARQGARRPHTHGLCRLSPSSHQGSRPRLSRGDLRKRGDPKTKQGLTKKGSSSTTQRGSRAQGGDQGGDRWASPTPEHRQLLASGLKLPVHHHRHALRRPPPTPSRPSMDTRTPFPVHHEKRQSRQSL